ncbi:response regulator [Rhodocytophaga rosea]|uniref:histidine kinase n=1 Tax=Rhodocytophaga rosea TaxID=2704465 RepID=A0A6C0GEI1_9BACT|nr:ATP-binding protein [Rhodocytophaga rosea]QHT66358.1 response regulator [Rhodocytophaga rosea]
MLAKKLSFKKGEATANYRLSHCYWALGDGEIAIGKGLEAVKIAQQEKLTIILGETYRILAMCYRDQQQIGQAKSYIRQAEILARQSNNWDLLARVYNMAGVIEYMANNFDNALLLYHKALSVSEEHPTSKFHLSQALSNIGEYYLNRDIDRSIGYFNQALISAKENNNRSAQAGIMADLGKTYTMKSNFAEAQSWLDSSLALAQELGLKRVVRYAYFHLADLKSHQGRTVESLEYMKEYYEVNQSLLNISKTRQIVELENQYESQRKEQRIQLLEQERRIGLIWKYVLIFGSVLSLTSLLIIYRLQSLRTKKAKELLLTQASLTTQLQETDLLKSRFFANISHEFRTPLSLILASVEEKLSKPAKNAAEQKSFFLIQRNAHRLLDLVNQLLDLSKLEAGKLQLQPKQGNLQAFIQLLCASFDSLAEIRGIQFSKHIHLNNSYAWFDDDKLEKIIGNILFNAFKFTPAGGSVSLSIDNLPHSEELIISIADTGKGITKEEQEHIFTPFYQSQYIVEEGLAGTGLGLSLVQELVNLHKGKIHLESMPEKGTTITVQLPLQPMGCTTLLEETPVAPPSMEHYKRRVDTRTPEQKVDTIHLEEAASLLVIEDNPDLRGFIAASFRNQFTIHTAKDGEEGWQIAVERMPDLIVSDVMMPALNGVALTEKLKSDERTSHIPIILLTAKADEKSRLEGLTKGADDYLSKPFSTAELRVRVVNLINQRKKLAAKYKSAIAQPVDEDLTPTIDEKFLLRAKAIVEHNLSNYGFGVEKLADEMNLSRAHLFRKFKALLDTSPSEFITDIRLQQAARMIRSKRDTIAQISYSVGFNEQSYFAKRFRKKFGVSPGEYADSII